MYLGVFAPVIRRKFIGGRVGLALSGGGDLLVEDILFAVFFLLFSFPLNLCVVPPFSGLKGRAG